MSRLLLRLLVLVCLLSLAFFVSSRFLATDEPTYQGRSLSSWLEDFDQTPWGTNTPVALAIRAMGTNTIPYLVEDILGQDPKWRDEARRHLWTSRYYWLRRSPSQRARTRASHALRALGSDAAPALPLLIEEVRKTGGKPALPWVGISAIAQNVTNAVSIIITDLEGPEYRPAIARLLNGISANPEVSIPYLILCLQDEDLNARQYALLALRQFGTNAVVTEPYLKQLLNDSNPSIRDEAFETLQSVRAGDFQN